MPVVLAPCPSKNACRRVRDALCCGPYLSGLCGRSPLFFGTVNTFNNVLKKINENQDIILSLRTVPLLDTSGISAIEDLIHQLEQEGRRVYLSGLNDPVRDYLQRAGILQRLGEDRIFWSAYEAIMAADHYRASQSAPPSATTPALVLEAKTSAVPGD